VKGQRKRAHSEKAGRRGGEQPEVTASEVKARKLKAQSQGAGISEGREAMFF
jgi:hypothetical protein